MFWVFLAGSTNGEQGAHPRGNPVARAVARGPGGSVEIVSRVLICVVSRVRFVFRASRM